MVSIAVVFYLLPSPHDYQKAQAISSVVPAVSEMRREVRLVVVPDDVSPALSEEEVEEVDPSDRERKKQPARIVRKGSDTELVDKAPAASVSVLEEETELETEPEPEPKKALASARTTSVPTVPFYSQFADISSPRWQKVGCGIASLAMVIDYYSDESISVDNLLQKGIAVGAYLDNAGWIHAGLIGLSKAYGLSGESRSLASLSMADAFHELERVVEEGPVMVSVHYTFEPTNPIPHLVVVNGVKDGKVFYNDPAEPSGGGSLSIAKFEGAWKKRYIEIRPS